MPYELIWEDRGVVMRYWGVASDHDLRQANLDTVNHPRFADIDYTLDDLTDVTRIDFSSDAMRWCADLDLRASKRNPSLRVAIVGEDKLLIGLSNMYRIILESQGGPWEQGQFATVDEARAWLAGEDQRREES